MELSAVNGELRARSDAAVQRLVEVQKTCGLKMRDDRNQRREQGSGWHRPIVIDIAMGLNDNLEAVPGLTSSKNSTRPVAPYFTRTKRQVARGASLTS